MWRSKAASIQGCPRSLPRREIAPQHREARLLQRVAPLRDARRGLSFAPRRALDCAQPPPLRRFEKPVPRGQKQSAAVGSLSGAGKGRLSRHWAQINSALWRGLNGWISALFRDKRPRHLRELNSSCPPLSFFSRKTLLSFFLSASFLFSLSQNISSITPEAARSQRCPYTPLHLRMDRRGHYEPSEPIKFRVGVIGSAQDT